MRQSKLDQNEGRRGSNNLEIVSCESGASAVKRQLLGDPKLDAIPSIMVARMIEDVVVLVLQANHMSVPSFLESNDGSFELMELRHENALACQGMRTQGQNVGSGNGEFNRNLGGCGGMVI